MADVFISYKAEDRRRVQPLVAALEADGLSVWWDTHIDAAAAWRETIEAELNAASCVIVIWSAKSVGPQGSFVRDEASRAMERGTYLPVKIEDCRPPLGFGETQAVSLKGWKGKRTDQHYQALLTATYAVMNRTAPSPSSAPVSTPWLSRRTILASGGVVAVAALGAGGWAWLGRRNGDDKSIAVLPFENLSGDPAQSYFSDGIAEELRSDLSRVPGLRVVARTSCEAVRNDVATVAARKLGVTTILTGSVRRSPDQVRVSTQLVDGNDGLERWSETYDRPPGDVLTIQTEIAQEVANALRLQFGPGTGVALGGTRNPQAQDLFLKASALGNRDTPEDVRSAIDLFDAAIALDPNYAQAYAFNSVTILWYNATFTDSAAQLLKAEAKAFDYARRAILIAPGYPGGHVALGNYHSIRLQFDQALTEYERASRLPGAPFESLTGYAGILLSKGRFRERDLVFQRAASIDPLNPDISSDVVRGLFLESRFNDAAEAAASRLRRLPKDRDLVTFLGYTQIMLGQTDAAVASFKSLDPTDWHQLEGLALAAARSGNRAEALASLAKFEQQHPSGSFYQFAQVQAQLGEGDAAFASLNMALGETDPGLQIVKIDPFLLPLHGDPRFAALINKLGLQ